MPDPTRRAQFIPPSTRLRRKAVNPTRGFGLTLSPDEVRRLEEVVERSSDKFNRAVADQLRLMRDGFASALAAPERRPDYIARIAPLAFDIKGLGGTFKYELLTAIAKSLHDFCGRLSGEVGDVQMAIVRTHIDALYAVLAGRVTGQGGDLERELLETIREAVARFA